LELANVRQSLELTRQQRQDATRILDFIRQRSQEGFELPLEVKKAELAVAQIEQRIVQLDGRQKNLERQLASLMGLPRGSAIPLDPASFNINEETREQDLIQRALETNQDVRQAEFERRAREHKLAGEVGSKWPSIDLVGEYGLFSKINNFDDYFNKFQRNNLNVGIQVRIPLMSADRSAKVALARSELTVADIQLRNKRENLELEISRQSQHLRELDAAREVARLERDVAQENLRVVQAGFDEGRVNSREVGNARLNEHDKWIAFSDSDFSYKKAQLELLNTSGELTRLFEQKP
jgi:outer membrane protein TolC